MARADQIIEVRDYIRVHAGTTATTLDGDDLRRFNRRLLEDAYPDGLEGVYRLRTEAIIRKLHATPRAVLCLSPHGTRPRRDLTTKLREIPPVILLDNIRARIHSAALPGAWRCTAV